MFEIVTSYFAFGQEQKSSLITQFCRQNKYQHLKNPILQTLQNKFTNNTIIQGSIQLFKALESLKPQLQVIFLGNSFSAQQIQIRRDYRKIGKCIEVRQFNYQKFRKSMYPNLIFFYGPSEEQNLNCAHGLANQIGYCRVTLPQNANSFIKQFKKTVNYTVSGLFTSKEELEILQHFFNIKVVHLQYNRIDLPQKSQYFDKQFELLVFLKARSYYHPINGFYDDIKVIDLVSQQLSPALVYAQVDTVEKRNYLDDYVHRNQQSTLILSTLQIQQINKRKNIRPAQTPSHKTNLLNQILYRDFNIKRAIVLEFPLLLHQILNFQSANRQFQLFIDLMSPQNTVYSKQYTMPMHFLQTQRRVVPDMDRPLQSYLNGSVDYWLVNGPVGSGKTTVAKYIAGYYGFRLIQYETYFATIKQKLLGPDDAEQVPVKKIIAHFKALMTKQYDGTFVIDGLPFENKDLEEWIKLIGTPSVINLQVAQNQTIKRTRKKNESDVNAQISEQETTKAKQTQAKSQNWLQKVRNMCPVARIHQLNLDSPFILSQKLINKIFRKNVYLVQSHNGVAFQNVALKNNLGFVNLYFNPLRQTLKIISKMPNKDVVICYYHQTQQKLVSQDLYWIQKNIGTIRYLAIWQPEETEAQQEKLQLQRPKVPQRPKVEGAEGEQKPAEQQQAQKKQVFDIYAYEWTKPLSPKNLSQWFIKSRKNLVKAQSCNEEQLFEKWSSIIGELQKSDDTAVYQTFK